MGTRKQSAPAQQLRTGESHMKHLARIKARNKRIALLALGVCLCLTLLACIGTGLYFLLREPEDDGRILSGVQVGGVHIGGMTPEEATNAIQLTIAQPMESTSMFVELPGASLTLAPKDTKIELDVEALVEDAYALGRSGSSLQQNIATLKNHVLPLLPYLNLDLEYIRSQVDAFADSYSIFITQPSVSISGERPAYSDSPEVVHQVLTITMGTPQFVLDAGDLYGAILDSYSLFQMNLSYAAPDRIEPDPLDLQSIFDTYCSLPVDAELDPVTFEITPEIVGYGFHIDALQRLIDEADYGQVLNISLEFLMPDITTKTFGEMFQDTLGSYTSTVDSTPNKNRDENLRLSCEAINGYVIKAGESFDFNLVLGPRTTEKGYHNAPHYLGSTTSAVGGGITQTASALYYSALLAGLQIDEHHHHSHAVPYTPYGTDAYINYGTENLVFTNNTKDPIRIQASFENGKVSIALLGTETRNYRLTIEIQILETVEPGIVYQYMAKDNVMGYEDGHVLQTGITGYTVKIDLIQCSLRNGAELQRDTIHTVHYDKRDQQVVRIEGTQPPAQPTDPSDPVEPTL